MESGRCGGGEGGGVAEGGGGLENAPYRSAPRGPPITGSAWRRAARARLANHLASVAVGCVSRAHRLHGKCRISAHETGDDRN